MLDKRTNPIPIAGRNVGCRIRMNAYRRMDFGIIFGQLNGRFARPNIDSHAKNIFYSRRNRSANDFRAIVAKVFLIEMGMRVEEGHEMRGRGKSEGGWMPFKG
jgi:hypothetical protein